MESTKSPWAQYRYVIIGIILLTCGIGFYEYLHLDSRADADVTRQLEQAGRDQQATTDGIDRAKDRLSTAQGTAGELRRDIGDAVEEAGRLVDQNRQASERLDRMSERIDRCQKLVSESTERTSSSKSILQGVLRQHEEAAGNSKN